MSTHTRSLFAEFSREAATIQVDYTVDGLVIADDDTGYVIAYDAAGSDYLILEGKRNEDGICFEPYWARFQFACDAAAIIARALEGYPLEVAAKTV